MGLGSPFLESRHNPKFKQWLEYARRPEDPDCPWIPVEGWKQLAELTGLPIELLLFCEPEDARLSPLATRARERVRISPRLMQTISQVESPQSVFAFVAKPRWEWDAMTPWVIFVDRLQDPGNLGTLFRTARATGLFSLAVSPGAVSCFNAKVVRASAASLFSVPFRESVSLNDLLERNYCVWATTPESGERLFDAQFEPPCALAIGNEGAGLAPDIEQSAHHRVTIPMAERSESLNAAVAGALVMYEVYRRKMAP